MTNRIKLALLILLVLLAGPVIGLGQQAPLSALESHVAAAQKAQEAHDFAAAANEYRQAVKLQPGMPELWANLGLMQQQAGDIPAANLSFHRSNLLNPELYVPNLFLGVNFVHTGKAMQAIPYLTRAERINKTDPQTPLALGRAYFASGKLGPAAREFERATTLDPKLGAAWFGLGITRLNQVEADAHTMSTENKSSAFAGALFAGSLAKQGRFSEAASLYRSLVDLHPQPPCIHSELGFALIRHHDSDNAATEFSGERAAHPECSLAFLGEARLALDKGDNHQAMTLLEELWNRDHGSFIANASVVLEGMPSDELDGLTATLSQPGDAMSAEFRNALLTVINDEGQRSNDNSAAPEPSHSVTEMTGSEGGLTADNHTAEEFYTTGDFRHCSQRIDPAASAANAAKLRLLAACSFFAGDNERALTAATALLNLQPHSPEALYWSIQANQRLALESLERFQQLDSNSSRSHVLLGDIYYQLERYDDAQVEYNKALAITPDDPAALLGLSTAYLSNNNAQQAMETAQIALKRAPDDPALNLIIAEALMASTQFPEAEPFLMKSLTAKPRMLAHVHALLGKVYAETGRTHDAIEQLRLGASSDETGSIHYLLARLYRQVGDTRDATVALEEVKTIKQRRDTAIKRVEDPDLSSLEASHNDTPDE